MKQKNIVLVVVALVLVILLFQFAKPVLTPPTDAYPWQVEVLSNGHSRVFGIELYATTLQQVVKKFQQEAELALFETGQQLTLEAYFKEVRLGGLSARFVFTLQTNASQLQAMRERAYKRKVVESGSARYALVATDIQQAMQLPVQSISYIPYINLEPELIEKRFGKPQRLVATSKTITHYLYPDKGLDLIEDSDGKEVLQYVLPGEFARLSQPLQAITP